jgi:hypothetical protein
MHQNQRTKMCPNCEGNVALEESICPYCGSSVFTKNENLTSQKSDDDIKSLSYEETLASLYPPPYKPRVIEPSYEKEEEQKDESDQKKQIEKKETNALLPTILFWVGVNIFVFSFILLLFSHNGVLYLQWNASYWYLYSLISLPLLYFGFRGIKNLN